MEQDKKDIEKKYHHLKSMSTKSAPESYKRKIESLERLTEKQQA